MNLRIAPCALLALLANGELHAQNLTGPIVKPYTPGSSGVTFGPLTNKTANDVWDFRIWLQPGPTEVAAFNLKASDCDVDPDMGGGNPTGDVAGPPDFDPTDNVDDRNVKIVVDTTNAQNDIVERNMTTNNPFHVTAKFTQNATVGGTVTITPTDIDCLDVVAKDTTGKVSTGSYNVDLGGGGKGMVTQVTYVGLVPVDEITISVASGLKIMRADVEPAAPHPTSEAGYCMTPGGCWSDTSSAPNFDPQSIPPGGASLVHLFAVTPADTIQPGTTFRLKWELVSPVVDPTTTATITIAAVSSVPVMSAWILAALVCAVVLAGAFLILRTRSARAV